MSRLYDARKDAGLSQTEVAAILRDKVDPRITQGAVSYMEQGFCIPSAEVLECLSELYYRAPSDLLEPIEQFAAENTKSDLKADTGLIAELIPIGKENAVKRSELAAALGGDRKARKALEAAKINGLIICNDMDGRGYYRPDRPEQLRRLLCENNSRIRSLSKQNKAIREALRCQ